MIRLLVTDVDGTLVEEGTPTLSPDYYDTIKALHKKGIQVVVASGRSYSSILDLFRPVEDYIWFIADGGAVIKTTEGLENVGDIPEDWARELWQDISQIPEAEGTYCSTNTVYIPHGDTYMSKMLYKGYRMNIVEQNGWEDFPKEPSGKISLFCRENVQEMADKYLIPKWKDRLHTVIAGEWWLDCMMPNINKGTALQTIMDRHGYVAEEVLATGDNMNDLEMITLAGIGLAVSTARPEVKAIADGIIPNFEEDGVLQEWKKYL